MICGECIWHMMDTHLTACETTWLLLSMYQALYASLRGKKRNLIKTTETSSYHIQDAQEGGRTPPTNPGTRGQTPAERSPETQDAASLTASRVSCLSCLLILRVFKLPEELPVYHSIFTVFLLI